MSALAGVAVADGAVGLDDSICRHLAAPPTAPAGALAGRPGGRLLGALDAARLVLLAIAAGRLA